MEMSKDSLVEAVQHNWIPLVVIVLCRKVWMIQCTLNRCLYISVNKLYNTCSLRGNHSKKKSRQKNSVK